MPEGTYRFQAGSIYCTVLADGYFTYPSRWFFPNADPIALAEALDARRSPREAILSPYACLLIENGRHVTLVDCGAGESHSTTGAIVARLEMEGIRPKNVDTVIFTHAHPDHIGGAVDARGRPVFPNARHVIAEKELEFWTASRAGMDGMRVPEDVKTSIRATARRILAQLRFQLDPIAGEAEVSPGVRVMPAPGHTPGHAAVEVSSGSGALLHLGDAAVHPLHLERPEWQNGFDLDAGPAAETRRGLLERASAAGMRVMGFHFPFPSVGSVQARAGGGWDWKPGC